MQGRTLFRGEVGFNGIVGARETYLSDHLEGDKLIEAVVGLYPTPANTLQRYAALLWMACSECLCGVFVSHIISFEMFITVATGDEREPDRAYNINGKSTLEGGVSQICFKAIFRIHPT